MVSFDSLIIFCYLRFWLLEPWVRSDSRSGSACWWRSLWACFSAAFAGMILNLPQCSSTCVLLLLLWFLLVVPSICCFRCNSWSSRPAFGLAGDPRESWESILYPWSRALFAAVIRLFLAPVVALFAVLAPLSGFFWIRSRFALVLSRYLLLRDFGVF